MVYNDQFEAIKSIRKSHKTIDKNESITYNEKSKYIDILKAQFSEYETALLFYHILAKKNSSYKKIAEKYALFEFVNSELVEEDVLLYKSGARFK